jgi:hypothetical protein
LGAQIIFAEADGLAGASGVAGFEPPQLVMLSMQANPATTRNIMG